MDSWAAGRRGGLTTAAGLPEACQRFSTKQKANWVNLRGFLNLC